MKLTRILLVLIIITVFINYCGGPKELTRDQYNQLSPQERLVYLERQINNNPDNVSYRKTLYQEYLNMEMPERAIPVLQQLLVIDPYQADVQYDYGELMMKQGERKIAYRAFVNALQSPGGSMYSDQIGRYVGSKYSTQQITQSSADDAFPYFSPDGSKLVYQTNSNNNWDIVEKDLATNENKTIINSPADEELPCYSPNGNVLVYTSNIDDIRPIDRKFKVREIYVTDFTNGYKQNLTKSIADDWLPRFSPDGKSILFVSERSDLRSIPYTEKQSDIYIMESNGDFHTRLTEFESNEGGACFSPDRNKIFFHSNRNGSYDIFVMNTDGTNSMTVVGSPDFNEVQPFVSANAQFFVYFSDQNGNFDIFKASVDGSEIEQLTFNPANDINPVLSPDNKFVAFQSDRNGNYDLFILNLEMQSQASTQDLVSQLNNLLAQP
jgi:TolB protein